MKTAGNKKYSKLVSKSKLKANSYELNSKKRYVITIYELRYA